MLLTILAAVPLLIWVYLVTGRGGFWRVSKNLAHANVKPPLSKHIVAIIPARNEAENIAAAIASLLEQDLPVPIHLVVVDDQSADGTAEAARTAAGRAHRTSQLSILTGQPLKPGWTGKLWALAQGITYAETLAPDYFLFTDADIRHGPNAVANLLATAESGGYDLASYMVKLACVSFAEKALIPAFVFFFLKLYPPAWVRSPKRKTAGAAGGCILIRPQALERIGGIAAIRQEVIDDCALARAVKRGGGPIWLGLTDQSESIRSYCGFSGIGAMISRTAFNQLRHSTFQLAGTLLGLFIVYLLPPLLLLTGRKLAVLLGGAAWLLMALSYLPMVRFYRRSAAWSLTLPGIAAFYAGATVHSALQYWRGRGGEWKGRVQDARVP